MKLIKQELQKNSSSITVQKKNTLVSISFIKEAAALKFFSQITQYASNAFLSGTAVQITKNTKYNSKNTQNQHKQEGAEKKNY